MVPATRPRPLGGAAAIARVDRDTFAEILKRAEHPLVVSTQGGFPRVYKYVTQYGGFYFQVKAKEALDFSREAEVVAAEKIRSAGDPMAW